MYADGWLPAAQRRFVLRELGKNVDGAARPGARLGMAIPVVELQAILCCSADLFEIQPADTSLTALCGLPSVPVD